MAQPIHGSFSHTPVLLKEILSNLRPKPGQTIVDCTVGGGGHALVLAEKLGAKGTLVGIDLDPAALDTTKEIFKKQKIKAKLILIKDNYSNISAALRAENISRVNAILADIGLSSYDLDQSGRGFSFQKDEPLDMRYNPEQERDAQFIVNSYQEKELTDIFRKYSEEKFSQRIARSIIATRQLHKIKTTTELFELIKHALPGAVRFKAADSVRRIFQALRIEVNRELENLENFLPRAFATLEPKGRLAVISFHSLEDRIVKQYFRELQKGCICPPDFPKCVCGKEPLATVLTHKPIIANAVEQQANPRSRPAKLRVIEKK